MSLTLVSHSGLYIQNVTVSEPQIYKTVFLIVMSLFLSEGSFQGDTGGYLMFCPTIYTKTFHLVVESVRAMWDMFQP